MKLEEIAKEAARLPEQERAALASQLLHGLGTTVYEVSDEEVLARVRDGNHDPGALITFDELISGLKRHER